MLKVGGILRLVTPVTKRVGYDESHTIRWRIEQVDPNLVKLRSINPDAKTTVRPRYEDRALVERDIADGWLEVT